MKKVVFIGDSITANFKHLSNYAHIVNMGVGGYKTTELLHSVKELRLHQPDIIVLMIGINDFMCNKRFYEHGYTIPFHKTYDALVDMICTNLPKAKLYLVSILPLNTKPEGLMNNENVLKYNVEISIINDFIKQKAKTYKATYLNLYKHFIEDGYLVKSYTLDGIHLNDLGYDHYLKFLKENANDIFI